MKKYSIGVVLSGCGVFDGSEIHEAVCTLLAIDKAGAEAVCVAPNIEQHHVINHLTSNEADEKRNVLVESARIARGSIKDIKELTIDEIDALVFPGGFGAAKNLSTFAFDGENCKVNEDVMEFTQKFHKTGKPIGAMCIAPAMVAKILGSEKPSLTIGNDQGTADKIEAMGASHSSCVATEFVHDSKTNIFTTPAYMLAGSIKEVYEGIEKMICELIAHLNQNG
ncbi:isoprenoid biosynthesis glyoxalase ElbB [Candidatus Riflebacteria bacterium]